MTTSKHSLSILKFLAIIVIAPIMVALSLPAVAQGPRGTQFASFSMQVSPAVIAPGHSGLLKIKIAISPGYHIQSAHPDDPSLIPTAFAPITTAGVRYGAVKFPKDSMVKIVGADKPQPAYIGTVAIVVPIKVASSAHRGTFTVGGTLTYQGCNQNACYPPAQNNISAALVVK